MKSLIVTVAGTATRFNQDTREDTLKCLYSIDGSENTLLYQILDKARDLDEFVIVGGFLYTKLEKYVNEELHEFRDKIKLIYNPEYRSYGSGYSLILGLQNASPLAEEIIFVEGDLYFESDDFDKVKKSMLNVITTNREPILAKKAVALYETTRHQIRYLYDTSHFFLEIKEPFLAIYNSGQVWKFKDMNKLAKVLEELTPAQVKGTNLEIIQGYFGDLDPEQYCIIEFSTWHNCNTVADYNIVYSKIIK